MILQGKKHFPKKYLDLFKDRIFFTQKEKDHLDKAFEREENRWKKFKNESKKRLTETAKINTLEKSVKKNIKDLLSAVWDEEEWGKENNNERMTVKEYKMKLIEFIMDF